MIEFYELSMERNLTLDTAKFVCLVLMVFGHIPPIDGRIYQVVNSFHMPFFFFASGLFFNPDRFGLKKGFQSLLLPYVYFNLLVILLNSIVDLLSSGTICYDHILTAFIAMLIGSSDFCCPFYPMPIGPSWFLISLFTVKICAKYLLRLKKSWTMLVVLSLFCLICVIESHFSWFIFSIDSSIIGLFFFFMAYYLKEPFLSFLNSKWLPYVIPCLLIGLSLSWSNGWVSMCAGRMGDSVLLFVLFALFGILTVVSLSKYLPLPFRLVDIFNYGAVFLICMNMWLMEYIMLIYKKVVLHDLMAFLYWHEKLMILALIFVISCPFILVLSHFCPWIIGRKFRKN